MLCIPADNKINILKHWLVEDRHTYHSRLICVSLTYLTRSSSFWRYTYIGSFKSRCIYYFIWWIFHQPINEVCSRLQLSDAAGSLQHGPLPQFVRSVRSWRPSGDLHNFRLHRRPRKSFAAMPDRYYIRIVILVCAFDNKNISSKIFLFKLGNIVHEIWAWLEYVSTNYTGYTCVWA